MLNDCVWEQTKLMKFYVSCDIGGLIWVIKWNCLQHAVASAFLAVLYSDYMLTSKTEVLYCDGKFYKPTDLRNFAISQVFNLLAISCNSFEWILETDSSFDV